MNYKEYKYIDDLLDSMLETMPLEQRVDFLSHVLTTTKNKRDYYLREWQAPIEDLDLNVRAYNCLKRAGIYTIDKLTSHTRIELFKIRNLGAGTLRHIEQQLANNGFKLKEEEEE